MAEPILKWAGGKRQILDQVLDHFPRDYRKRRFHEPMLGAGAVTFRTEPRAGSVNDINDRLVAFYRAVRDSPEKLIRRSKSHVYSRDYFYEARKKFNLPARSGALDPIEEASLLLYLNRTCYNGLYRVNRKGEFNVPFGGYKDPDFVQEARVREGSKILKRMDIRSGDFGYILDEAKKGDVVYFDPPYQPVSRTSAFTAYHKDGFDEREQERLRDTMAELHKNGVFVILSNSDAPDVRALYESLKGFHITRIAARRAINCNGSRRGKVGEVIVSNVPPELVRVRF